MGLSDVVRSAVATASTITRDLQVTVEHWAWTADDATGKGTYPAKVDRYALVEHKSRRIRSTNGDDVVAQHKVTFLDPIKPNGSAQRKEPIDERDKIVLPDGTTGPILAIEGLLDAGDKTKRAYLYEVYLG